MRDSAHQKEEDGSFTYIQKRFLLALLHDLYLEMMTFQLDLHELHVLGILKKK